MAVFTAVSLDDLTPWLKQFPLGKAVALKGIASGIENSNFFLTTEQGEYVLTIFENLDFEQLPFYLNLMRHLAEHDSVGQSLELDARKQTLLRSLQLRPGAWSLQAPVAQPGRKTPRGRATLPESRILGAPRESAWPWLWAEGPRHSPGL